MSVFEAIDGDSYSFGPFRLDQKERRLWKSGEEVPLHPKGFDLLALLVREAGHLKRRTELIEALWPRTIVEENNLTVHLSLVRKALGEKRGAAQYIQTVSRHGYRFIGEVAVHGGARPTDAFPAPH